MSHNHFDHLNLVLASCRSMRSCCRYVGTKEGVSPAARPPCSTSRGVTGCDVSLNCYRTITGSHNWSTKVELLMAGREGEGHLGKLAPDQYPDITTDPNDPHRKLGLSSEVLQICYIHVPCTYEEIKRVTYFTDHEG